MADETIITAERKHGQADVRLVAARYPSSSGAKTLPAEGVALGVSVEARVNDGRWIADCPTGDGGAEYVSFDNPVFFCCECRNVAVGHLAIRVVVPPAAKRQAIEDVLLARPNARNRHWLPFERVADLRAENERVR